MKDRYKVLAEKYEMVTEENADAKITSIIEQLVALHHPEDKEEFVKLLKKYVSYLYEPPFRGYDGIGRVHWKTSDVVEKILGNKIRTDLRRGKNTPTNYFYNVLTAYTRLYDDPKNWKHFGPEGAQGEFDREFAEWCKSMAVRTAQQQNTSIHKVDLSNF